MATITPCKQSRNFLETHESLEDLAVPAGVVAITIIDEDQRGPTVMVPAAEFYAMREQFDQVIANEKSSARQAMFQTAADFLLAAPGSQATGRDAAIDLVAQILNYLQCQPDATLRAALLAGVDHVLEESGRVHLIGIAGHGALVWAISEGQEAELSS